MQKQWLFKLTGIIGLFIILTGCFQGEQSLKEKIDPPQDAEEVNNLDNGTMDDEDAGKTEDKDEMVDGDKKGEDKVATETETVARQLFLLDSNGMVASQTLEIPKLDSKEVATQALEYLVEGGPVTNILPNGFQAVLPVGTQILGLNLQEDGTMVVDVSEEFKNYDAQDELKILQAMTYTLTQFENVDNIRLWINGYPQNEMPVNGTPVAEGYSRANGINLMKTDTVDLMNSEAVTIYYPTEFNENRYFVPVTQRVETGEDNLYHSIVQAMLKGPGYSNNFTHVFNAGATLTKDPTLKGGILELMFNQDILKEPGDSKIADEVMETLVRTLTDYEGVEAVQVKVEDVEKLFNEKGELYNEPVSKKNFLSTEKL